MLQLDSLPSLLTFFTSLWPLQPSFHSLSATGSFPPWGLCKFYSCYFKSSFPDRSQAEMMNFNSLLQYRCAQARTLEKTNQGRNQQGASVQQITDSTLNLAQSRLIASLYPLVPLRMPWKQATQEYCCSYHSYRIGRQYSLSALGQELRISCAPFTLSDWVQLWEARAEVQVINNAWELQVRKALFRPATLMHA